MRRESALKRLEKHLASHAVHHSKDKEPMSEEKFVSHDRVQQEEFKHLKELMV